MIIQVVSKIYIFIKSIFEKSKRSFMCKAIDIANTFIEIGKDKTIPVSNMKLQKLLYYAQGWHLALTDKPLFKESLQKWDFGPVCPEIYEEFKGYKGDFIFEPSCYGLVLKKNEETYKFLELIWNIYGKYSAIELSNLSHKESPWITTEMYEIISIDKIKKCFIQMKLNFEGEQVCRC